MRGAVLFRLAALAAMLALAGCAGQQTRVLVLPQPGHDSVVEVTPRTTSAPTQKIRTAPGVSAPVKNKTTLLTKPYQRAIVESENPVKVELGNAADIKSRYSFLFAAQPPSAQQYQLFFLSNNTQLTPESKARLDDVITRAMTRPGNEIVVTGHTDSVGPAEVNDRLSLRRAEVIRQAIIARGFAPARIYAAGRGARDLLVPTGAQKAEQKNRRVEITVR
jgi:outer membrane protein OmpA-like peptidoglycan-associated protein